MFPFLMNLVFRQLKSGLDTFVCMARDSKHEPWRSAFPVGPEEQSLGRVQRDGSGRRHSAGNEGSSETSVQSRNLDLVEVALHPVQVPTDPVDRQALGRLEAVLDDRPDVGQGPADQGSAVDLVIHDVRPEHEVLLLGVVEVDGDGVLESGDQRSDDPAVDVDGPEFVSRAEDDHRSGVVVLALAGEVVRLKEVAVVTEALVPLPGHDLALLGAGTPSVARVVLGALGQVSWVLERKLLTFNYLFYLFVST